MGSDYERPGEKNATNPDMNQNNSHQKKESAQHDYCRTEITELQGQDLYADFAAKLHENQGSSEATQVLLCTCLSLTPSICKTRKSIR